MSDAKLSKDKRGGIEAATIYPLSVFSELTGLGRKAVTRLRRRGMPVRHAGRQMFVLGSDFIEWARIAPPRKASADTLPDLLDQRGALQPTEATNG